MVDLNVILIPKYLHAEMSSRYDVASAITPRDGVGSVLAARELGFTLDELIRELRRARLTRFKQVGNRTYSSTAWLCRASKRIETVVLHIGNNRFRPGDEKVFQNSFNTTSRLAHYYVRHPRKAERVIRDLWEYVEVNYG